MLTKKQIWRRTPSSSHSGSRKGNHMRSIPGITIEKGESTRIPIYRSSSEPIVTQFTPSCLPKSTSDLEFTELKSKKVRFSETSRVVLVPCLNEYRSRGLHMQLWWENQDYTQFKKSAAQELSHMLNKVGEDLKDILRICHSDGNDLKDEITNSSHLSEVVSGKRENEEVNVRVVTQGGKSQDNNDLVQSHELVTNSSLMLDMRKPLQ